MGWGTRAQAHLPLHTVPELWSNMFMHANVNLNTYIGRKIQVEKYNSKTASQENEVNA